MNKKHRHAVYLLPILLAAICLPVVAHPGRTDGDGGHTDRSTGEYHYHHGYGAHQHYDTDGDGVANCPYRIKRATVKKDEDPSSSTPKATIEKDTVTESSAQSSSEKKQERKSFDLEILGVVILGTLFFGGIFWDFVKDLINKFKKR